MGALGAVIAARLREWGTVGLPVERELFGTYRPDDVAASVDSWCRRHLGSPIDYYKFFDSSSGSVHGVVLRDGRAVVVKGHRAAVQRDYLAAVMEVQQALADSGYPAPRPLAGPVPSGNGHVTAEVMLDRSSGVDGHDPRVRRVLAAGLAQFVSLSRPHRDRLAGVAHPMHVTEGAIYPVPHSPRFDFASTGAGAEWIDGLAVRARTHPRSWDRDDVVVHGDWRIENLSIRADRLIGVFDWDSVHVAPEVVAVATAATTFSVDWQQPAGHRFPSPREIGAFVRDYEIARTEAFSDPERDMLASAMVTSLTYGARCEHADPGQSPPTHDSQRGLLAKLGVALLDEGIAILER